LWFWHAAFGFPGLNDINIWERSSLFESKVNGEHEKLDFDFVVDGEVFTKLFYLVNGIHPSLSHFSSSEPDPHTKIAYNFATDQEAHWKDIERGFGVLKIKFLALTHPINLRYRDDIFYLVLAAILQHNMMVAACLDSGKEECAAMYNTIETTVEESGNMECGDDILERDGDDDVDKEEDESMLRQFRFEVAHKRWPALYDCEGALKLKTAMMRRLYKQRLGAHTMSTAYDMVDTYDPLSC
jgi:hypothetical protein